MVHDELKHVAEMNNKHEYCWHTMAWLYMYTSSLMVNFLNTACHLRILTTCHTTGC